MALRQVPEVVINALTGERTERVAWVECVVAGDAEDQAIQQAIAAESSNDLTLRQQAEAALADLRTYRDRASPTNAQTVAAVKLLCRVVIGLIRLHLRKLDGAD